jgi:hypothetical protein
MQPQEPSSFSGGSRAKVHGPWSEGRASGSEVCGPTPTVHPARCMAQGPRPPDLRTLDLQRTGVMLHGPRSTDQRPQTSAHNAQGRCYTGPAPRSLVLGPKLQPRSGNAETVEASCARATSPNANRASRIWRPNKIGACLQQGGGKKGGWGSGWWRFRRDEKAGVTPKAGRALPGVAGNSTVYG